MKLAEEQIADRLRQLGTWERTDEKWIVRKYRFPSFPAAIAFVNRVAETAEAMNHHPMISIDYRMVGLRLTTWHAGGLTELDFRSAETYDKIYGEMAQR